MAFSDIFDAEEFKYQSKYIRTPHMAPDARGGRTLIVVMFLETFFEEDVGQDT